MEPVIQQDENHEYARLIAEDRVIYIADAPKRGRGGYACLGCHKEMQAILRHIQGHKPYFRHHVLDVPTAERCTFKKEDYRRQIVTTTLELEKLIKVPQLYKFPPKGVEGLAMPLSPSRIVAADRVEKYKFFYEDLDGNIQETLHYQPEFGDLLFKADVVFYDADSNPVLLVKMVKKFGLTTAERAGLQRLGIDAVQLTIPKESPEAIQRSLMKADRTKWIYSNEEQHTNYFSIPAETGEGISAIDGEQRKLFEETFDCRKVQIGNLIRAVDRQVASESYRTADDGNRSIIGRTELAITRAGERRAEFEEQHRTGTEAAYQPEFDGIEARRRSLELAFSQLRGRQANLEARYRSKRKRLEDETAAFDAEIRTAETAAGGTGRTVEELEDDLTTAHDGAVKRVRRSFAKGIEFVEGKRRNAEYTISRERTAISGIRQRLENLPGEFAALQETAGSDFDRKEAFEDGEIARIDTDREHLPERFAAAQRRFDADFKTDYDSIGTEPSPGLDRMLSDGPLKTALEAYRDHQRHRRAKEFLASEAGQVWLRANKH